MKIGIFGGGFNPPHLGHVTSIQTVHKKLGLDHVFVIPNFQNPLKTPIEGPSPQDRLKMTELAVKDLGSTVTVDDLEIKRGGPSFTIDTIKTYRKKYSAEELFLIIGLDNFETFNRWKDYKKIITECNLIVTTRPGHNLPASKEDLPEFWKELVVEYDFNYLELSTGRHIQQIQIKDVDTSSSDLRKMIRSGKSSIKHLPLAVETYIHEKQLYRPVGDKIGDFEKFTDFCAQQLFNKKAINLRGYDLRQMSAPTEFALVCSGTSSRHTAALAQNLSQSVKEEFGVFPQGLEGISEGRWVVMDYGSLMIHIFYDFVRSEYRLEDLWRTAQELKLEDRTGIK